MSEETQSAGSDFPKDQPRRYRPFILGIVAVSLTLYIANSWRPWEPRVHGKPLSDWIEQYRHGRHLEAQEALHYLYSRGDPQANGAIELLNTPDVAWEKKLTEFRTKLSRDKNFHVVSRRAQRHRGLELLRAMGMSAKPALPHIRPWLSSDDALMRSAAIETVFNTGAQDPETIQSLIDSDFNLRTTDAIQALASFHQVRPETTRFALSYLAKRMESLPATRAEDIRFVWAVCAVTQQLGSDAEPLAPFLENLLNSDEKFTRIVAEQTLWRITPEKFPPARRAKKLAEWLESRSFMLRDVTFRELMAPDVVTAPYERRIATALQKHIKVGRLHLITDELIASLSLGKEAESLLPELKKHLGNQDKAVAIRAARILWMITGNAEEALPTLLKNLRAYDGRHAALVIAEMGPTARHATEELSEDMKWFTRHPQFPYAHWSLTGTIEKGAPILRGLLSAGAPNQRVEETLKFVVKMGEDAAALAPELVKIANRPTSTFSECRLAITALKSSAPDRLAEIDPERLEEFEAAK